MTTGSSAERHEFQTETKQLLDLMIHSLYSNRDIFLRELISNASDALDKLRFEGLTSSELLPEEELHVFLEVDAEARTLTVMDNGIGMSREEIKENIGTIAKSGTRELQELLKKGDQEVPPEFIGQFGVGFYSSFLVADRVELVSRRAGETTATRWVSTGDGSYTVTDAERPQAGTSVILHLKPVDEEDGLADYVDEWVVRGLVTRYSDFVSYPIKMQVERREPVLGADGKPLEGVLPKVTQEVQTLNSMKAIWTRDEDEVTEEEYKEFYKHITHDWNEPVRHIRTKIEGNFEAQALLFIPGKAPYDLFHREMSRRGIQLYIKRVFIMDECKDLIPDFLRFIKGVVDAEDLSLNVSRELLQQDRQIKAVRKHLIKRILTAFKALRDEDREAYTQFWLEFGAVIKEGLLTPDGDRDRILELILCHSTLDEAKPTTLGEYIARLPEEQEAIYFLTASSVEAARRSPHLEAFRDKGVEVLLFTDPVDEVWLQLAPEFEKKKLQSIGKGEVELGTEAERKKAVEQRQEQTEDLKDLMTALRGAVQDDVSEVRLSSRLTSSAACLVTEEGGITPQMEWLMRHSGQKLPKIKRILELNPQHEVLTKLKGMYGENVADPAIKDYAKLLYGQAVLAEGGQLEDAAEFARLVADVMARVG